jgi:hypothetical protein
MNIVINATVTQAPDRSDLLVMDAAIATENATRLAAGGTQPQLPSSTNAEKRTSYATILAQRLNAAHLANANAALELAGAGSLARQVRQATAGATPAQLNAALAALTT